MTYHAYYKSPDLIGPWVCRRLAIPYVIFQGIYSTRRRKSIRTLPGYVLNRHALMRADHVFSNRKEDLVNLRRLIPDDRLTYIAPGIDPEAFTFDSGARSELRDSWKIPENTPVVLSAAMFRPGVKTEGLIWTINACAALCRLGKPVHLVIAGDGKERKTLRDLAESLLSGNVRFVGKIPRDRMYRFYSAGDIFAFPGIRETLGMVYLEAQACGLPVVAFDNGGIPEVVQDRVTGFLTPLFDMSAFTDAITRILDDAPLRRKMGEAPPAHMSANLMISTGIICRWKPLSGRFLPAANRQDHGLDRLPQYPHRGFYASLFNAPFLPAPVIDAGVSRDFVIRGKTRFRHIAGRGCAAASGRPGKRAF